MAATAEMVKIACGIKPEMAMLVPEGRMEVTTEGGLDVAANEAKLKESVAKLAAAGIMTSVFIDAELKQVEAAARIGARGLRDPHGSLRARIPFEGTRRGKRTGDGRGREGPNAPARRSAGSACASTRATR